MPHRRGTLALTPQEAVEVVDLYCWGARVMDICMIYDIHKRTLKMYVTRAGKKPFTSPGRPILESALRRPVIIKSTRLQIPEGVRISSADDPDVDQLIRMCAHEQRDKRIGARQ